MSNRFSHRKPAGIGLALSMLMFLVSCPNPNVGGGNSIRNPGDLDPSFQVLGIYTPVILGGSWPVALQSDGMILVGGEFSRYGGVSRTNLARLKADGTVDASFNAGASIGGVSRLGIQSDGKIVVGAPFRRLSAAGAADATFHTGAFSDYYEIDCALVMPDDKILVGGWFTTFDGTARRDILRLNADGTLDTGFVADSALSTKLYGVYCIEPLASGKILVGGTPANGGPAIARLNSDGTLDASFDPGAGADGAVYAIKSQSGGGILVGGSFSNFGGAARAGLARLGDDGVLDASFSPGAGIAQSIANASKRVAAIVPLADGKALIGGCFDSYDGTHRSNLARIGADGKLDASFDPGIAAGTGIYNEEVHTMRLLPDGRLLISGMFGYRDDLPNILEILFVD